MSRCYLIPYKSGTDYSVAVDYDANFNPTTIKDNLDTPTPTQTVGGYTWDTHGNKLSQFDGRATPATTTYAYDPYGNVSDVTQPIDLSATPQLSATTHYDYDTLGRQVQRTDPRNPIYTTKTSYDLLGRVVSVERRIDATTTTVSCSHYDLNGNVDEEADGLRRHIRYTYDNLNRVTAVTDPYPGAGNICVAGSALTQTEPPSWVKRVYTGYDWRGNVTKHTDQINHLTQTFYNLAGQVIEVKAADNSSTYSVYDGAGRAVYQTDGLVTTAPSGLAMQPCTVPGFVPPAHTGVSCYNAADQLVQSLALTVVGTTNTARSTQYVYDVAGRQQSVTDAKNATTQYDYNARGQLLTLTYPSVPCPTGTCVPKVYYAYDAAGNVTKQTTPTASDRATALADVTIRTVTSYTEANVVKTVTTPVGATSSDTATRNVSYGYDAGGNQISVTDALNHKTQFAYDGVGRLVAKWLPDNTDISQKPSEVYGYDVVGNRTSQQMPDGNITRFTYDSATTNDYLNHLTKIVYPDAATPQVTYAYSYLAAARQKVVMDTRGTTTYAFDVRDRLSSATTTKTGSPTQSVSYSYDTASNRTGVTAQSGTGGSAIYTTTAYGYDIANRLCTAVNTTTATANVPSCGTTNSSTYTFSYDVLGNRTGLTYPNGNGVSVPTDGTGFDALNRTLKLVQTTTSGTTTYSYGYDLNGNKISLNETGGANVGATAWSYDNAQRLTNETRTGSGSPSWNVSYTYYDSDTRHTLSTGGTTITYSANVLDQITGDGSHSFGYDKRGNLVSDGATGNAYAFDAANRMSQALVISGTITYGYDGEGRRISQKQGSTLTNYLWDEGSAYGDVLLETNPTGVMQASYMLAGGEVLSQTKSGGTSYLLYDKQGSTRAVAGTNGSTVESPVFDAYGSLRDVSSTPGTKYLYTGQQFDAPTGLYSLRARYYNTATRPVPEPRYGE